MMPTDANTTSNFLENKQVNVFTEQVTLFSNLNVNFGNMSGLK